MKRILLAITMLILVLPAVQRAGAAEVSVDFFYNNLNDGNWIEAGDYGYGFQPAVAVNNPRWRPYSDGYWAYTDVGWTWVSYEESFGWACYHYGRWARIADHGWVWFPGNDLEWGPAWVSWRTGGDYVGWAPLPPRGGMQVVYEGRAITGHVDVEFDIGPAYYNFVDVRYIGEPVLRERIFESSQNVTYINKTVNVTNITYNNSTVYNYGPDYETVNRYSSRPVPRLSLQRETSVDASVALQSGGLTKVQGDRLVVAAPMRIQRSAQTVAPKTVKVRVAQPKIEHGWSGLSDPKAQAELKQKMQTEDSKTVPPPSIQPRTGGGAAANVSAGASVAPGASASAAASTSAAVSASPATSASPFEKGKGKHKGMAAEQNAAASPSASVAGAAAVASPSERVKGGKGKRAEQNLPGATLGASASPSVTTESPPAMERGRKGKHGEQNPPSTMPATSTSPGVTSESSALMDRGRKGKRSEQTFPGATPETAVSPGATSETNAPMERGRKGKHGEQNLPASTPPGTSASTGVSTETNASMERGRKGKHAEQNASGESTNAMPPTGAASASAEGNAETVGKGKHKGAERSDLNGPPPAVGAGAGANANIQEQRKAQQMPAENAGQGEKGKGKKKGEASPTPGPQ